MLTLPIPKTSVLPYTRPGSAFPAVETETTAPLWKRLGSSANLLRAVAIGTVVLTLALYVFLAVQAHSRNRQEVESRLLYTLDLVHEHAVKVMETQALVAGQIQEILRGYDDEAIRANETSFTSRLITLSKELPQIQGIWILDANGRPLVTTSLVPVPKELDLSDRTYFRVQRDNTDHGPYVSSALLGRASDVTFFQISHPARRCAVRRRYRHLDVSGVISRSSIAAPRWKSRSPPPCSARTARSWRAIRHPSSGCMN